MGRPRQRRPRDRVRGDLRLPPRAGAQVSDRAGSRGRPRHRRRPRSLQEARVGRPASFRPRRHERRGQSAAPSNVAAAAARRISPVALPRPRRGADSARTVRGGFKPLEDAVATAELAGEPPLRRTRGSCSCSSATSRARRTAGASARRPLRTTRSGSARRERRSGASRAWRVLAWINGRACRYGAAAEAFERAIDYARRAGDVRQERRASLQYVQAAVYGPTPVEEAIVTVREVMERVEGDRQAGAVVVSSSGSSRRCGATSIEHASCTTRRSSRSKTSGYPSMRRRFPSTRAASSSSSATSKCGGGGGGQHLVQHIVLDYLPVVIASNHLLICLTFFD